jgi:hypothetical protein
VSNTSGDNQLNKGEQSISVEIKPIEVVSTRIILASDVSIEASRVNSQDQHLFEHALLGGISEQSFLK